MNSPAIAIPAYFALFIFITVLSAVLFFAALLFPRARRMLAGLGRWIESGR